MNYTIGLDSATLSALSGIGKIGMDKAGEYYALGVNYNLMLASILFYASLVGAIFFFVICILCLALSRDNDGDDTRIGPAVVCFVFVIFLAISSAVNYVQMKNVKYYTINQIIDKVK